MNRQKALVHYLLAVSVFRKWLVEGLISEDELHGIEAIVARKYGVSESSIYR